ncbi:organic cation transporter protein-like isoform X2 [Plodia interpunctella]|uniref:organic cation transporter protein-like isoform X2 n=1 Tax=Plodia interpunctella TaxID=58824 RepID=UPI002367DCB6|nr:organic cation transporter protein-like isoform X2 [Plodia interpunctella]
MSGVTPAMGLDAILAELGAFGKYNVINYTILLLPVLLAGMFGSVYIFEAPDINYRCRIDECENLYNDSKWLEYAIPKKDGSFMKCRKYPSLNSHLDNIDNATCLAKDFDTTKLTDCSSYVYSDEDSAVKDFDLGCEQLKRTLVGSMHNAGFFVALPLTGFISDRYGRKLALAISSLFNGIFGILRSFSVNYVMFVSFEFLETAFGAGAYTTAFVLAMELVGPKGRVFGNTLINIVYVCGAVTMAGLAWQLQNWRHLLRVIYTPAIFIVSYIWILNESVRWLLSKGRQHEAVAILKKAAKINKVNIAPELFSPLYELNNVSPNHNNEKDKLNEPVEAAKPKETATFANVIKSRIIRTRLFVCSFLWITCTLVYYGLSINSVSLAGNQYVNFMLVVLVEIPGNIVCLVVLDRFGRKKPLIITYVLSALLCISLSAIPPGGWSLTVYLLGKFNITVAYSSVYIYVSEVFPTSVRQSLLAVCSTTGRIGSTLAPITPLLAKYYKQLPVIFFGSMALAAAALVFTLPETINVQLPDTVEEAEQLSRREPEKQKEVA